MTRFAAPLALASSFLLHATNAFAIPVVCTTNGHYYDLIQSSVPWAVALSTADLLTFDPDGAGSQPPLDGYLVTVTSAAEDTFLSTSLAARAAFGSERPTLPWKGLGDGRLDRRREMR